MQLAGAKAEIGCDLDEVFDTANIAAKNAGVIVYVHKQYGTRIYALVLLTHAATMSVSLSPCVVPGREPSFHLEENEMELGLGITS